VEVPQQDERDKTYGGGTMKNKQLYFLQNQNATHAFSNKREDCQFSFYSLNGWIYDLWSRKEKM
jgi:hypothetical protein